MLEPGACRAALPFGPSPLPEISRVMVSRFSNALVRVVEAGLWLGFLALIITVGLQVVARNVFRIPLIWTLDVAQLLFSWLIFIGAAIAFRKGAHYTVDILPASKAWLNAVLAVVGFLAAALVTYVLIVPGFTLVSIRTGGSIPSLGISTLWLYLPIPLAGLILAVFLVEALVARIGRRPS